MSKESVLLFFVTIACGIQSPYPPRHTLNLSVKTFYPENDSIKILSYQFDSLNSLIRDNKISKAKASAHTSKLITLLKTAYLKQRGKNPVTWHFPLPGYSARSIGGVNGNGYIAKGYDYFDGDRHKGHPAHDIFIRDKNQDCKDDKTGQYVPVVSLTAGVVVATEKDWKESSTLRGGKYIWVYAPIDNSLLYYAHNNEVFVTPGQLLNPGDTIATVGRTGFNAFKKRSPTHLHVTQLMFDQDLYPKPVNLYNALVKLSG